MKKILLATITAYVCISINAQEKGDKYIGVSLNTSFGSLTTESNDGMYSTYQNSPLNTSLSIQAEFGYFVANNLRLALALGVPFSSDPYSLSDNTWLNDNTIGLQINPNIAYYIKLVDGLYYTPEIGFSAEFGTYKHEVSPSTFYNTNYTGWDVYAHLFALEFKVSPRFAIGVGCCSVSYSYYRVNDNNSDAYFSNGQFHFGLNNTSLQARLYF